LNYVYGNIETIISEKLIIEEILNSDNFSKYIYLENVEKYIWKSELKGFKRGILFFKNQEIRIDLSIFRNYFKPMIEISLDNEIVFSAYIDSSSDEWLNLIISIINYSGKKDNRNIYFKLKEIVNREENIYFISDSFKDKF